MFRRSSLWSRRSVIKTGGAAGIAAVAGIQAPASAQSKRLPRGDARTIIEQRVQSTSIVDTHEHLIEEELRLKGKHRRIKANDWSFLLSHYLNSDLATCGMPRKDQDAFFSPETDPLRKWFIEKVQHGYFG